jgi:hypothetical protein
MLGLHSHRPDSVLGVPFGEASVQQLGGISRELASFVSPAIATALILGVRGAAAFGLDAGMVGTAVMTLHPALDADDDPLRAAGPVVRDGRSELSR